MIQNTLQSVGGIGLYGTVSICLFVLVFGVALLLAGIKNRTFLDHMGQVPLNDGSLHPEPASPDLQTAETSSTSPSQP